MRFTFNDNYQSRLEQAWTKFINNEPFDFSFMRPEIFESWQISKYYNVDPFKLQHTPLCESALKKLQLQNKELIEVATPKMNELHNLIKDSFSYIFLTDQEGIVLHAIGDIKNLVLSGPYTRLLPGSSWRNADAGTNSAALCLTMKKPIQVHGNEHFKKYYKTHTCTGAPVFDENNNIIGSINVSAQTMHVTSHTLGMVANIANSIENSLRFKKAASELYKLQNKPLSTKTDLHVGIMVLDRNNTIVHINTEMLITLQLQRNLAIGKNISEVLKIKTINTAKQFNIFSIKSNSYDLFVNIYPIRTKSSPISKKLSIYKIESDDEDILTILIFANTSDAAADKKFNIRKRTDTTFKAHYTFDSILGSSKEILKTISECKVAAANDSNVLITGESGTGKELFAQAIHNATNRADRPFVAINCGAIPASLAESELFGYEQGAFTGGRKEGAAGKFELANGGTIFLDEIGEMPLDMQVSLLRVLENREITRIGGSKVIPLNIKIIAATNKNLYDSVAKGIFREDLFYRLNVMNIQIPPLRKRKQDILILTKHFIKLFCPDNESICIDNDAYNALLSYKWPGNVRELSNAIERAVNLCDKNILTLDDLPDNLRIPSAIGSDASMASIAEDLKENEQLHEKKLINMESTLFIKTLQDCHGNVKYAAKTLGLNSRTLYRRLKKFNIRPKDYRL